MLCQKSFSDKQLSAVNIDFEKRSLTDEHLSIISIDTQSSFSFLCLSHSMLMWAVCDLLLDTDCVFMSGSVSVINFL